MNIEIKHDPDQMTWMRYRECWAWGSGSWEYTKIEKDFDPESYTELVEDPMSVMTEHYRGLDMEVIEKPPQEWLEAQIKTKKLCLEVIEKVIEGYQTDLQHHYGSETPT